MKTTAEQDFCKYYVCLFWMWLALFSLLAGMTYIAAKIPPELEPSVETSVNRNEITIGDDIVYTVKITYDPSVTLEASTPGMELGQFEIKDVKIGTPERQGNRMVRTDHYILSTYFTGDYTFPPLTVRFRTKSGQEGECQAAGFDVHVRALTPEESENLTIRDIKPPVSVKGKSRWPLVAAFCGGILVVAMGAFWFVFLRRRERVAVSLEPPLPADERALMALKALRENETLLTERRYKEFSIRLSEILRVYIHGRWGIVALDRTTEELLLEFEREGVALDIQDRFMEIFSECDLMKFARQEGRVDQALQLVESAVQIVELSRERVSQFGEGVAEPEVAATTETADAQQGGAR